MLNGPIGTEIIILHIKRSRTRHADYAAELKITSQDMCCTPQKGITPEAPGLYSNILIIYQHRGTN